MTPFHAVLRDRAKPKRVLIVGFIYGGTDVRAVFIDGRRMYSACLRDFENVEPPPVSEELADYIVARRALLGEKT